MSSALLSLALASIALVGTHFVMSHPLRSAMVGMLGQRGFLLVYSLVSIAALYWMSQAFSAAPPGSPVSGVPGQALWLLASVLTLIALVLLFGSFRNNPALPQTSASKVEAARPTGVFKVTRHPMMWSFALWAVAHILLFWSARTLIAASAILVLALVGARLQDRKKERLLGEAWTGWERQTTYWPRWHSLFAAGPVLWIAAALAWLAITFAHIHVGGVPAGVWRWL